MPFNLGPVEIGLIVVLVLLIFGPKRLPEMARSFGEAIQEFKKTGKKMQADVKSALEDEPVKTTTTTTTTTPDSANKIS
ncbi:MAG: twin-arginine translocase TatA/TatE family subunit [Candidatus Poribacteria bacterium]|nr:twin-arginine translocase TatA/TatE family subunit [Candidatus Poribacteria bacterium]